MLIKDDGSIDDNGHGDDNPDNKVGWADIRPALGRQARRWPN